jgi:hypothetical protein
MRLSRASPFSSSDARRGEGGDLGLAFDKRKFELAAQAFESREMLLSLHFASLDLRLYVGSFRIISHS